MIELELTYLAKYIPAEVLKAKAERVVDVYIPEDSSIAHPNLRIRKKAGKYEITKKMPINNDDSSVQSERTIPLTRQEFDNLCKTSRRLVVKDRHKLRLAGRDAEVDIFQEKLKGLVLIDFEFATETAKNSFKPPDCCLADVTQENFIAGGILAGKAYADIGPALKNFDYKAL